MGTWRPSRPAASDRISDIPELCQDNFDAIEDIISVEHKTFTEPGSGQHQLGRSGVVKRGTTAEIVALSTPPTGAVGFDTTLGVFVYFDGSVWKYFGQDQWSRCRSHMTSATAITADSAPMTAVFDTESFDPLGEYDTSTGVFTAKASGSYAAVVSISFVASGSQVTSGVCSATGNVTVTWATSGSSLNWQNIDEYPTPNDVDFNSSSTSGQTDIVSGGTFANLPAGSTGIAANVAWRGRRRGCPCNLSCYGYTLDCTCNNICYGQGCTCNQACYGYATCSCNYTMYSAGKSCDCHLICYGYSACSCNNTCYGQSCSCNAMCYSQGASGCTCNQTCYQEDYIRPAAVIRVGSTDYPSSETIVTTGFENYSSTWPTDPSTGLAWTSEGASALNKFGYKIANVAEAGTSPCTADISQAYLGLSWWPPRPVITVGLYKNNNLIEAAYQPLHEAGTASYQTIQLLTIIQLNPNDTLHVRVSKTIVNDTIYGDAKYSYLAIHRLGGACL